MRVIALNKFEYANKLRQAGEEFEIESEKDAKILFLAKQIVIKPSAIPIEPKPEAKQTETRAMKAEESKPEKTSAKPDRKRYMRRDMRAEE